MENSASPTPVRVLLVDDETYWLRWVQIQLTDLHIELTVAKTAEEAWERLRHENFDRLLTDTNLPQMDGIALLKLVKAYRPEIRVLVFFTSHFRPEVTREEILKVGADEVMTKDDAPDLLHDWMIRTGVPRGKLSLVPTGIPLSPKIR